MKKILVVDDEPDLRDMLRFALETEGFEVLEAADTQKAYWLITDQDPDLVLLDWMLPGGSGIELLSRLKKEEATQSLPVIMVTAKAREEDIIQGLDMGAHDYITKPFSLKELLARIRTIFRHTEDDDVNHQLRVGDLVLELDNRRVTLGSQVLMLGPTEFKLLQFFMLHPERAHARKQILQHIWGNNACVDARTVDVSIRRLRKTLQSAHPVYSELIQTVRGTGYRFSPRDLVAA
ncbi:two-component response regulator PhoB [marine gamma proteobacterium HTCC2080]|jgi:two-component system phosphate regulon response regulator PhoB|nr:two-component response regulator PhoB [marine gamma proteobacterium HTCC2080]